MQIVPLEWILSAFVEKIKEMKMKQWILLLVSVFLFACSEDNSSSGEIQEESSSSVSEFSPIVFTKLSSNKLLSGESKETVLSICFKTSILFVINPCQK